MNDLAYSALKEAQANAISNYVIEWGGRKIESIRRAVRDAGVRAGLKERVTPHMLRHTAACLMIEAGRPIEEVAQYLGHTSTKVTFSTYARYSPDYLQKAARALEI